MSSKITPVDCCIILKNLPDLYLILNTDLEIVEVSDSYLKSTMRVKSDVIGKYAFEVFPDNPTANKAMERSISSIKRALKTKKPDSLSAHRYDIQTRDGNFEEHYWNITNVPVLDANNEVKYIIHRVEDVTKFLKVKNGHAKVEHEELRDVAVIDAQLSAIVEFTDDAIFMTTAEGNILAFNSAAQLMYGYTPEELIGKPASLLYPDHKNGEYRRAAQFVNEGKPIRFLETERKHKSGTLIPLSITISPIKDKSGNVVAACCIERDITEWKKMEIMKDEFISVVSHELRTPITAVCGALAILEGNLTKLSKDKSDSLFAIARNNSERLIRLINDILDIEQLEHGRIQFYLQPTNVEELVKKAVANNSSLGTAANVKIQLIETVKDVKINVDPNRLMQAITNLISNAVKFSPPSGRVRLKLKKIENSVRISVYNEGDPIPKEFRNKIFQKFSRADNTNTRVAGGTGLGLSISKAIVEEMGGFITYQSSEKEGTVFHIDLPVVVTKTLETPALAE